MLLNCRVTLWFSTQTMIAGSQFAPSRLRQKSGVVMPDDLIWRQVGPGEEVSFTFDGRGRGRQSVSQEIKINQLVVKLDGWQGKLFTFCLIFACLFHFIVVKYAIFLVQKCPPFPSTEWALTFAKRCPSRTLLCNLQTLHRVKI